MLIDLKKTIESNGFKSLTNVEIKYDELIVSASEFKGYDSIREQVEIAAKNGANRPPIAKSSGH